MCVRGRGRGQIEDLAGAHLLAEISVGAVLELDARERAGELAATGDPGDGAALVEEVGGVVQLHALLLDHAHPQHLALLLIGNELGWQHLHACPPMISMLGVITVLDSGLTVVDLVHI